MKQNKAFYFHEEVFSLSIPEEKIEFIGRSLPHFRNIAHQLSKNYTMHNLSLRRENISEYLRVHSKDYLDSILMKQAGENVSLKINCECSGLEYAIPGFEYTLGGLYQAIDFVKQDYNSRVFCSTLPGHHSYADHGHGYCLLNPMSVAVRKAQQEGFKNILIIDWDLHHGDGTQSIFAYDNSVYQISIHSAIDLYMSMMRIWEQGTTEFAQSIGHCNIPVLDALYDEKFIKEVEFKGEYYRADSCKEQFSKKLNNLPFKPELIFIFSGFDSHIDDCGKNITDWTDFDYELLTKAVVDIAKKHNCPIISTTGGGYNVASSLSAAKHHINTLMNYKA